MKNRCKAKILKNILFILLLLTIMVTSVSAQYFPPVPPEQIILRETPILVSFTTPQKAVIIDVANFDPEQIIKKVTLTFREPVLSISFTIYYLKEKPPELPDPPETPLIYFTIRTSENLLENIENVTILFNVEKKLIKERGVDEKTITLNRFSEGVWEKVTTKKITEDEKYLYYEAKSPGLSHFAATGVLMPPPFPPWIALFICIVVVVILTGIYLHRKRKRFRTMDY